jgi:hypothetical protein
MKQDDFWLRLEGWVEELEFQEYLIRRQAAVIISQCFTVKKPIEINRLWPKRKEKNLIDDNARATLLRLKEEETTAKIREIEATKRALDKLKKNASGKDRC